MSAIKRSLAALLIAAVALFAQLTPSKAAIALVNHVSGSSAVSGGLSGNINTTGSNLILIFVSSYQGSGFVSINNPIDNMGNTYFHRTTLKTSPTGFVIDLWECVGCTVGATHNFTVSDVSAFSSYTVLTFSGVASSSPFGNSTTATIGTSQTSAQAGTITPSVNGSLVVSTLLMQGNMTGSMSVNSGLTIMDQVPFSPTEGNASGYLIQGTAAAINPTWTGFNTGGNETAVLNAWYLPAGAVLPSSGLFPPTIP